VLAGVDQLWYGIHPYAHHVWAGISYESGPGWHYYRVHTAQNFKSSGTAGSYDTLEGAVDHIRNIYPNARPIYTRAGIDFGNQIVQDTLF
jgi:hypothetical protein